MSLSRSPGIRGSAAITYVAVDRDGLASELVGPASEVAKSLENETQVDASMADGLAVVCGR